MPRFRLDHTFLLQVNASSKVISKVWIRLGKAKLKQRSVSFINEAQIQTMGGKTRQKEPQTYTHTHTLNKQKKTLWKGKENRTVEQLLWFTLAVTITYRLRSKTEKWSNKQKSNWTSGLSVITSWAYISTTLLRLHEIMS